ASADTQVVIRIQPLGRAPAGPAAHLSALYEKFFSQEMGLESVSIKRDGAREKSHTEQLLVKGLHALTLAKVEEGMHLFCPAQEPYTLVRVSVRALNHPTATGDDPFRLPPVIRIYNEQSGTLDLRSELMTPGLPAVSELRA